MERLASKIVLPDDKASFASLIRDAVATLPDGSLKSSLKKNISSHVDYLWTKAEKNSTSQISNEFNVCSQFSYDACLFNLDRGFVNKEDHVIRLAQIPDFPPTIMSALTAAAPGAGASSVSISATAVSSALKSFKADVVACGSMSVCHFHLAQLSSALVALGEACAAKGSCGKETTSAIVFSVRAVLEFLVLYNIRTSSVVSIDYDDGDHSDFNLFFTPAIPVPSDSVQQLLVQVFSSSLNLLLSDPDSAADASTPDFTNASSRSRVRVHSSSSDSDDDSSDSSGGHGRRPTAVAVSSGRPLLAAVLDAAIVVLLATDAATPTGSAYVSGGAALLDVLSRLRAPPVAPAPEKRGASGVAAAAAAAAAATAHLSAVYKRVLLDLPPPGRRDSVGYLR